ncbi:Isochorismatase domain-containing protein 1 [Actinomortierella ambigua]|nr:Isochorismatase domain-containing protein 1 [Actinomortierella ambigua]
MSALRNVGRVHRSTTAFLLCDIQERFRSLIWQYPSVIATAQKMVASHKILDVPLIVTEHYPKAFGLTVPEIDVSSAQVNLSKTKFSMYIPEVKKELKGVKSVVLFGIESHVCVLQTALDLLEDNIDVHVLADGVSSINQSEVEIALNRIKAAGGYVTTSESILFQLVGDATDEKFKAISKLVKETQESTANNKLFTFKSNI